MSVKCCDSCPYPDGLKTLWCTKHPKISDFEYKRRLKVRAEEVGLDYHCVSIIRTYYYQEKIYALDIIDRLEHKIKNLGNGNRKTKYLTTINFLKNIKYPRFWDIVKPYDYSPY